MASHGDEMTGPLRHLGNLERLRRHLIDKASEREGNGWPADMERAEAEAVAWALLELRPLFEPVGRGTPVQ